MIRFRESGILLKKLLYIMRILYSRRCEEFTTKQSILKYAWIASRNARNDGILAFTF